MLTGATEETVNDTLLASAYKLKAATTTTYPSSNKASRPFNVDRHGFVVGEGAGVLLLEEYQHAINRKAVIYAEIIGYG